VEAVQNIAELATVNLARVMVLDAIPGMGNVDPPMGCYVVDPGAYVVAAVGFVARPRITVDPTATLVIVQWRCLLPEYHRRQSR